jgi:hypothetical protein
VADIPPVISSITPRSHVTRDTKKNVRRVGTRHIQKKKLTEHRSKENHGCKEDVALHVEGLMRKKELLDNLERASAMVFTFGMREK